MGVLTQVRDSGERFLEWPELNSDQHRVLLGVLPVSLGFDCLMKVAEAVGWPLRFRTDLEFCARVEVSAAERFGFTLREAGCDTYTRQHQTLTAQYYVSHLHPSRLRHFVVEDLVAREVSGEALLAFTRTLPHRFLLQQWRPGMLQVDRLGVVPVVREVFLPDREIQSLLKPLQEWEAKAVFPLQNMHEMDRYCETVVKDLQVVF